MSRLRSVCAILLAIPLIVFGSNYFFGFIDQQPDDGSSGYQMLMAMHAGGLMGPVSISHILVGLLLLLPKTRFFAGLMQLPVSLGITSFHATMMPGPGLGIAGAMLMLNLGVLASRPMLSRVLSAAPT